MTNSTSLTADQQAAHILLSELRTRIAVQPLPYQYGIEARALESLWEIFKLTRQAMKDYPGCQHFASLATNMLNIDLRPVTAKWHRAHKSGLLDSKDGSNEFRADLAILQNKLREFSLKLQVMAYGEAIPDALTPPVISSQEIEHCFASVTFGIESNDTNGIQNAIEINTAESNEISERRAHYRINKQKNENAIGLALSGGGIRSATFCLGVVQVLSERGLMKDFDYLSTVSGGGYTGSFITSRIGEGKDFSEIAKPFGPDTEAVRHVRQNAKYLSSKDLKQRWLMITSSVIGLLLNWAPPLLFLALVAFCSNHLTISTEYWKLIWQPLGFLTAISICVYVFIIENEKARTTWPKVIALFTFATVLIFSFQLIGEGYWLFKRYISSIHGSLIGYLAISIVAIPATIRFLPVFGTPSKKKIILKMVQWAAGCIVPLIALIVFYYLRLIGTLPEDNSLPILNLLSHISGNTVLIMLMGLLGLITYKLNVNFTGLHKVYRDQLAKTFIYNEDLKPNLPLEKINPSHKAPYHLLNATVNLPSSSSRVIRDRRGDFFLFSKCWSGSAAVGYYKTSEWYPRVDLATTMAISGAAASPQMGPSSKPHLSALLTLLNARLGYWITNPNRKEKATPGFIRLLSEMTGIFMSEKSKWLNLSDGGHIENMGIYELLRRRCKFIVCVDGESDPQSTFGGKLTLVRHAQIDFGIRMEPRLDDVRFNPESKFSKSHSHLLRIHYPDRGPGRPAEIGLMLYLKLSLTGDEAELLKRYRTNNPDFPHQSTIDQFYDEEQFEVYRQLGVHVAEGVFSPALLTENPNPSDIENWFRQLAKNMLEPAIFR